MSCIAKKINSCILVASAKPNMRERREVRFSKIFLTDYIGIGNSSFNSGSRFSNKAFKNLSLSFSA